MMMIKTMMRMNDVEGSKGEDVSESISGEDSEIVILYVTAVYLNDKKQVKKQIVKKNHFVSSLSIKFSQSSGLCFTFINPKMFFIASFNFYYECQKIFIITFKLL